MLEAREDDPREDRDPLEEMEDVPPVATCADIVIL